jgi:hypothetical protein
MAKNRTQAGACPAAAFSAAAGLCLALVQTTTAATDQTIPVRAPGFVLGAPASITDGTTKFTAALVPNNPDALPYHLAAIKQSPQPAGYGPKAATPYFTVRFALPVPPENDPDATGPLAGLSPDVWAHNHSPGLEILPNGDALAVYFSAANSRGASENTNTTRFIQARLRYGAEQWDLPELFCDFDGFNDQSALLWNDQGTIRFFGGGRGVTPMLPFKMASSTNNGASWTLTLPQLDRPANDFTPQPINSAFRGADGAMFFAMDAAGDSSFVWRSPDGIHWHDQGGRTGARHSTVVPLDNHGTLLAIGGKNNSVNGWTPQNISTNGGVTWSTNQATPFPALGGNQRPSLIRLANGHLFYVSDSYIRKSGKSPDDWTLGQGAFVAISTNNGANWHCKMLPVTLPHHEDKHFGTVGYVTARQAPNGVIHLLTSMTQPCLHYELNEAWVFSDAGDQLAEAFGGRIQQFTENYSSGKTRASWSARICPHGRYLLNGLETDYYENGQKQHEVTYVNGWKDGAETYWLADGRKVWAWAHDVQQHRSVWTQYWPDGRKKSESTWNTQPMARDLSRTFPGLVADGPATLWNADGSVQFTGSFTNGLLVKKVNP